MNSPRNIYKEDVNFPELASQDSAFAKVLKPNGQLDFSDPESVLQLTKSLLRRDFNLDITLPLDRLCPPVPNRLNYILWIQDLVDTSSAFYSDRYDPDREMIGLDIGTGASCIYPLLGCVTRPKWRFVATDIDELSLSYARKNVEVNNLSSRIKLLKTSPTAPLISLDALGLESITTTLTNPPFYSSLPALLSAAAQKSRPPNTACTGSANEMIYPGGETVFISRIIAESLILRERVQWYSSMLGKLSSVADIIAELKRHGIDNFAVTEFIQGSRTRRWGVAWSFGDLRPGMSTARGGVLGHGVAKALLPFPCEYSIGLTVHSGAGEGRGAAFDGVKERVNAVVEDLEVQWMWKDGIAMGVGFAARNVWSRAARRAARREDEDDDDDDEMVFGFKISVKEIDGDGEQGKGIQVLVRWLKGHDSALFESFCGFLKRKLES